MPIESMILQKQEGATLIELIFSVAIMLVLLTAFYGLFISFHESYQLQTAIAEMQQQARVAEGIVSHEIMSSGYDPTGILFRSDDLPNPDRKTRGESKAHCIRAGHEAEPILEASPVVFHYLADLNGNGRIDEASDIDEDVRYEWVGPGGKDACGIRRTPLTLYRDSGGGAQEVALNVEIFKLEYFDENEFPLPSQDLTRMQRSRIRRVKIVLVTRSDQKGEILPRNHAQRRLISDVWLKNR